MIQKALNLRFSFKVKKSAALHICVTLVRSIVANTVFLSSDAVKLSFHVTVLVYFISLTVGILIVILFSIIVAGAAAVVADISVTMHLCGLSIGEKIRITVHIVPTNELTTSIAI